MAVSFSDTSTHQKEDCSLGWQGALSLLGTAQWKEITGYLF